MLKQLITNILSSPQQILPAKKGRKIAQSIVELDGMEFLIRVVYVEESYCYEVVTVYKTTKIRKYWRDYNENTL